VTAVLFDASVNRRHVAPVFSTLAAANFAVEWLPANAPDEDVLDLARRLDRILVTEDNDFGALIFRHRLPPPTGVILVLANRIPASLRAARLAAAAPAALSEALGRFVVIGPSYTRARPLPAA
jgi:predicted nuclease of predicted toxin-antitoxin system